jgi:hypothetical protein
MTLGDLAKRQAQKIPISTVGEKVEAFLPPPFPPVAPMQMERLYSRFESANRLIGGRAWATSVLWEDA